MSNKHEFRLEIEPMGAVRSTQKGQFTKAVTKYHDWMKQVGWLWKIEVLKNKLNPEFVIPEEIDYITFALSIPDPSKGTKKEQEERLSLIGNPHKKKPDIDNLFKAFVDAVCYKKDDSHVHTVCNMRKIYAPYNQGHIIIGFRLPL
jgi:Holliday junction resolvase RusA-like endonuclease